MYLYHYDTSPLFSQIDFHCVISMYVTLLHIPKLPQNNYDEMLILI